MFSEVVRDSAWIMDSMCVHFRWCTVALSAGRPHGSSTTRSCASVNLTTIRIIRLTSCRMHGGKCSLVYWKYYAEHLISIAFACFVSIWLLLFEGRWCRKLKIYDSFFCILSRSVHYPPETSSIMIMARMVATIKQVISSLLF